MGLPITKVTQYQSGVYSLPINTISQKDLIANIPGYEQKYLCDLLGYDLYLLFIDDLDATTNLPTTERFINIYNILNVENVCGNEKYLSLGISEMLQGFVCFEYLRSLEFQQTMVGTKISDSANSEASKNSNSKGFLLYNTSIEYYQAIQLYICQNIDVYPEFSGIVKETLSLV